MANNSKLQVCARRHAEIVFKGVDCPLCICRDSNDKLLDKVSKLIKENEDTLDNFMGKEYDT